jgi:hypothetical protein
MGLACGLRAEVTRIGAALDDLGNRVLAEQGVGHRLERERAVVE